MPTCRHSCPLLLLIPLPSDSETLAPELDACPPSPAVVRIIVSSRRTDDLVGLSSAQTHHIGLSVAQLVFPLRSADNDELTHGASVDAASSVAAATVNLSVAYG